MRAATVVQVLPDLFKFYCMFYFTCDRSCRPNTHHRCRRDSTRQFRRVGGVYWALSCYHNCDKTCNKSCNTYTSLAAPISITLRVGLQCYAGTCILQLITAYRPIDGISRLLSERVPDWQAWDGAAHFLAACYFYCSGLLHVVTCSFQVVSFNFYRNKW